MKKIVIAIDGYSSSGKSTMAKQLAKEIGYSYIDTGAMYRAVTLYAMRNDLISPDGEINHQELVKALQDINIEFKVDGSTGRSLTYLNGENVEGEIRTLAVSNLVSPIAAVSEVRAHLVRLQQAMGQQRGVVMDGRDIGTVVFPDAELKVFVNASPEVRAMRRYKEMLEKGMQPDYDDVYENLCKRDYIDSHRADSPLRKADDAIELDNAEMTHDQQMKWLLEQYKRVVGQ